MMVYSNIVHIMYMTRCCIQKRLFFNLPFTFQLSNANRYSHLLAASLVSTKDHFCTNKVEYDAKRQLYIQKHPSEIKEQSLLDETEIQNEANELEIPTTFKEFVSNQEQTLKSKLESKITMDCKVTIEEWDAIIESVLKMRGTINEKNINAIILSLCSELQSLTLGKSFFNYLKSTNKQINRPTYGNYLRLFYDCSKDCKSTDLDEINNIYRELLHRYPLLDSFTAEKAVCALSITKNWMEYEKLFKDIRMFYNPTQHVYSVVIKSAFRNGDLDLGWSLMEEMQLNGQNTPDNVFIFWLEMGGKKKSEALKKLLEFLKRFNMKPSLYMSEVLKQTFEKLGGSRIGKFTNITRRGECRNCHTTLEPASVSLEDYNHLKKAFLNPVLIGKDIFQKTKPEEFNEFLKFLENTAPYNVVLDGLNIGLNIHKSKKSPSTCAFQLKSVVRHFVSKNKKVLVLGRKHMKNWNSNDMNYVYNHAHIFLAENISHDDPFLLYAALYSGLGTCFVSKDMMRKHKFLLSDPKLQTTFVKWQAQHQYFITYIDNYGDVVLKEPVSFMQNIHVNSRGDWHIPYVVKENFTSEVGVDNYHKHWLCLTTKSMPPQHPFRTYERQRQSNKYRVALKSILDT